MTRVRATAVAVLLSVVAVAPRAHALDVAACEASFEHAQNLELDTKLIAARGAYAQCMDATCPSLLRVECTRRFESLSPRMPSIVVGARNAAGTDLVDVRLDVDGTTVATTLTGRAIELDPGVHHVRVAGRGAADERDVVIREGEKLRPLTFTLAVPSSIEPPSRTPSSASAGLPVGFYALGAVSVAAFATSAVVGVGALSDDAELHRTCAPGCSQRAEDGVRDRFIVADVALGIGIVAAAAATWFFISSRRASDVAFAPPAIRF